MQDNLHYMSDLVRSGDRERYWSALLAPESERDDLIALYAFHLEIARAPEQVSEPHLGEIRLQWWHDALSAAFRGDPADHPVLADMVAMALRRNLPQAALLGMIEARRFDLQESLLPDFDALEAYLTATAGSVFSLGARILGSNAEEADRLGHSAGIAYGLCGMIRSLPYHAARGRVFLPQSLLAKHGLHPDAIIMRDDNPDLRAALREMAQRAAQALVSFRAGALGLPRLIRPAYLPSALVSRYLEKLSAPDYRPFETSLGLNPLYSYVLIWRAYLKGSF